MKTFDKIIYVSSDRNKDSNSYLRYKNFKKIYPNTLLFYSSHNLRRFDIRRFRANRFVYHSIYDEINNNFCKVVESFKPDLIWLDKNLTISFESLSNLKKRFKFYIISFTNDNPFSLRKSEKNIWLEYIKNLSICDIVFIAQINQIPFYKKFKINKIVRYLHGVDYSFIDENNYLKVGNKIRFIGNCEKNRIKLIKNILSKIDNFEVFGPNWYRYIESFPFLINPKINGPIWDRKSYNKKIQDSLGCINLLSKSNNDEIASRIFEITSCGGLAISESNKQLKKIFSKNEILYYRDDDDLIEKLIFLNNNPQVTLNFRKNAFNKIKNLKLDYEYTIPRWLSYLDVKEDFIDEYDNLKQ